MASKARAAEESGAGASPGEAAGLPTGSSAAGTAPHRITLRIAASRLEAHRQPCAFDLVIPAELLFWITGHVLGSAECGWDKGPAAFEVCRLTPEPATGAKGKAQTPHEDTTTDDSTTIIGIDLEDRDSTSAPHTGLQEHATAWGRDSCVLQGTPPGIPAHWRRIADSTPYPTERENP